MKKVDRDPFLKEVEKGAPLKHAETVHDASAPKIEGMFPFFPLIFTLPYFSIPRSHYLSTH